MKKKDEVSKDQTDASALSDHIEKKAAEAETEKRREAQEAHRKAKIELAKAKAAAAKAEVVKGQADEVAALGQRELKVVDREAQRKEAMRKQLEKFMAENAGEIKEKKIGIWKSDVAVKKLNLIEWMAEHPEAELYIDRVPEPGCSTNGVVFAPNSRQLLPEHIWKDIYGRTSAREEVERDLSVDKKIDLPSRTYSGAETRGGNRFR
jgi:hypothetical protein